jgi:hypothetical protein
MAHYLFNFSQGDPEQAVALLRAKMWPIGGDERHRDALAPGDLILIYLPPPADELIGQAELASAVHEWTSAEAEVYPGDAPGGVLLSHAEEWDPPVAIRLNIGARPQQAGGRRVLPAVTADEQVQSDAVTLVRRLVRTPELRSRHCGMRSETQNLGWLVTVGLGGSRGIASHAPGLGGPERYPAGADPPGPGRGVIAMAMGWSTALIGVRAVLVAVRIGVTVPRPRLTGGQAT